MGHWKGVRRDTGEYVELRCKRLACPTCGPVRQAYLGHVARRRMLDAIDAGNPLYALTFTGGDRGLWVDDASLAFRRTGDHLRRRLGVLGYVRAVHLDPGRGGAHVHALVALADVLTRQQRAELHRAGQRAGFGHIWKCSRVRTEQRAERAATYLTGQLVADGRALSGSGAKLVAWSSSWRPQGWV